MTKKLLPVICGAAILGVLVNNFLLYQDIIFDKHGGAIMMGPYANVAVFITVAFTILCVLLASGTLRSKYVQPYHLDPAVTRNRTLRKIDACLRDVSGHLENQAEENKALGGFVENGKKEVGKLK